MLLKRKVVVFDVQCDHCKKVLISDERSAIAAASRATFNHNWQAANFVPDGLPLTQASVEAYTHVCNDCLKRGKRSVLKT